MKRENLILDRSFQFAVRIVKLAIYLKKEKKEYTLSQQILRSGTSIGANITEAQDAQSKKDFISKCYIALKEARETDYWIRLLIETDYLPKTHQKVISIQKELDEIISMLISILKTSKSDNIS
jgi:four helix bundle protein